MKYRKELNSSAVRLIVVGIIFMFLVPADPLMGSGFDSAPLPAATVDSPDINTVVMQMDSTEMEDTFIWEHPTYRESNYGATNFVALGFETSGHELRGMVRFPVDSISDGNILSATLSFYVSSIYGNDNDNLGLNVTAHPVVQPWTEGSGDYWTTPLGSKNDTNWNNRTYGVQWGAPGGDYLTTIVSYANISQDSVWFSLNITDAVLAWKNGSLPNYGLMLTGSPVNSSADVYAWLISSDDINYPELHPKLTITYGARINQPVSAINTDEDTPVDIDLSGRGEGTVVSTSGSDGASNYWPFYTQRVSGRFQALYYPDQVGAEGKIMRIALNRTSMAANNISNLRIYMAHTNLTNLTDTFDNNYLGFLTEVLNEPEYVLNSSDSDSWLYFDLNGNFTYDSKYNLLVEIRWNGTGGTTVPTWSSSAGGLRRAYAFGDSTYTAAGSDGLLPVMKFYVDAVKTGILDEKGVNNIIPFCPGFSTYDAMRMQVLYPSTTVQNSGYIKEIAFRLGDTYQNWANVSQFSVRMAHSDNTSLSTNFDENYIGSLEEVVNRSYFNASTDGNHGWLSIPLDTPFHYDETHNLLVEIRWDGGSRDPSHSGVGLQTVQTGNDTRLIADSTNASTGSVGDVEYAARFTFANYPAFTWSATSSNTSLFTASIVNNALHIEPVANAYGSGTVELTLHNGPYSTTQTIPVTINPVNDAPVISAVPDITCTEDIAYTLDMADYMSDVDNSLDELTVSTDSAYATVNGSVIRFLYPEGILGDNINITVEDPQHLSATIEVQVTVTPVNDAPVISGLPQIISCTEDLNYTLDMSLYTSDVDNSLEDLTFTTNSQYATVDGHNITLNYPEGITEETITIIVEDPAHLNATASVDVSITPVNDAPVISDLPVSITCTEAADYRLDMSLYVSDADNSLDELTFSTNSSYATVDGHNIIFNYPYGSNGETVTITVEDPGHLTATADMHVFINLGERPSVLNLSADGNRIKVLFDTDMNMSSVESAFSMSKNSSSVTGTFIWLDARTFVFTPSVVVNGTYDINIGTGAMAATGAPMLSAYSGNYTAPADLDSDGDGMPDLWESVNGFNPLNYSDAATDADHDGLSNFLEYREGTEPRNNDTDGDGIVDGFDAAPLTPFTPTEDTGSASQSSAAFDPMLILVILLLVVVVILAVMLVRKKPGAPASQPQGYVPVETAAPPAEAYEGQPPAPPAEENLAETPAETRESIQGGKAEGGTQEDTVSAEDSDVPGEVLDLNEF